MYKTWENATVTKAYIVETIIGVFALTEDNRIIQAAPFPKNPRRIADALDRQRKGEIPREVSILVEGLIEKGVKKIVSTNQPLVEAIQARWGVEVEQVEESGPGEFVRENLQSLAVEYGVVAGASELLELSHEVSTLMARGAVREAMSGSEVLIPPTVQLLGDVDNTLNSLSSRLREWYGLHFPELSRRVRDHRLYAEIVLRLGDRSNITREGLMELTLKKGEAARVERAAQTSMGAQLVPHDLEEVQRLASQTLSLYRYRGQLVEYVSGLAEGVAPNIAYLAGSLLAAKLIEKAGGLRRMAMMPSSTIQVLGAEKAMFRALKTRARPPKHGLIYLHPYVHGAPRDRRGSRARGLAAKIAIAARADAFSGNFIADMLERQLRKA